MLLKQVQKPIPGNGKIITADDDILKEEEKFYENLYKSKVEDDSVTFLCNNNIIPELIKSEEDMICDEVITENKCHESLSNF